MFESLTRVFKIPELRNKLLFTFGMLAIYRIGYAIPLPGVDTERLAASINAEGVLGQIAQTAAMFTGGNFEQSTIFGLGILPYISAAIIFQLLATVVPALEKLQKEGQIGYKKIQEYTRYATVGLALFQSFIWMNLMWGTTPADSFVFPDVRDSGAVPYYLLGMMTLTTGTVFLMWLGEQIDEYGIGNGISLIIAAGIIGHMPGVIAQIFLQFQLTGGGTEGGMNAGKVAMLIVMFLTVVAGAIFITQAQRRIPIQQAKQVRGRRMMMGNRSYLPLRVNHSGVMPIIFASAIMLFPMLLADWLARTGGDTFFGNFMSAVATSLHDGAGFLHVVMYIIMIYFFAYFWTTVQFKPKDIANQLRDYGSFIPGLRPGKRTSDYLESVMERITYVGAGFLSVIALLPGVIAAVMGIDPTISAFLGGTGLLIVVSVTLDFVQRVEAQLSMRNYGTFLDPTGGQDSQRMRGAYGG